MRRELITAIEQDGLNNRIVNMLFIVHNENIDLQEAIKKSAAEYLNTDEGLLAYSGNGNSFKWEDFWKVVPNEICLKHGFEKDTVSISRETKVDFNEELVSEKDLVFSEEKLERLKEELFDNGIEVIEEFCGCGIPEHYEKDSIDNMMDEIASQMSVKELLQFYEKYFLSGEKRKRRLIQDIGIAQRLTPKSSTFEVNYLVGEQAGWYACRNDGSGSKVLSIYSDKPLLTQMEAETYGMDVEAILEELNVPHQIKNQNCLNSGNYSQMLSVYPNKHLNTQIETYGVDVDSKMDELNIPQKVMSQIRLNSGNESEPDWIPVDTGLFPRDNENVQITYLGIYDRTPYCDGIAYRKSGKWYWALDDSDIVVPITAWKQNCKAYKETEADKAWVPVNTGLFPEEQEAVQVTYLGYNDHKPHCDAFAFLENGKWYWSLDEGDVKVPIIAWQQTGEAYQ